MHIQDLNNVLLPEKTRNGYFIVSIFGVNSGNNLSICYTGKLYINGICMPSGLCISCFQGQKQNPFLKQNLTKCVNADPRPDGSVNGCVICQCFKPTSSY